jgi:hypothetical protein
MNDRGKNLKKMIPFAIIFIVFEVTDTFSLIADSDRINYMFYYPSSGYK